MNRDALIDQLAQTGDGRTAMVVDLCGAVVDVEGVRYDPEGHCVVIALDQADLEGAFRELRERTIRPLAPDPLHSPSRDVSR